MTFKQYTRYLAILGLVCVHGLVEYGILAVLVTRLTEAGDMILPTATMCVNAYEGFSSILITIVGQLSDTYIGHFKTILFTNAAFISGLGMLWYEAQYLNFKLFFVALVLLTLGKAGRDISLRAFLDDQFRKNMEESKLQHLSQANPKVSRIVSWAARILFRRSPSEPLREEENEIIRVNIPRRLSWRFSWVVGIVLAIVFSNQEWKRLTMICTLAMVGGFGIFLLGFPCYARKRPSGSSLRYAFMIAKAAISKRHLNYPISHHQLFKNDTTDTEILPRIALLRWLDKAAIVEASPPSRSESTEQENVVGKRIFEVAQVREVKHLLKMLPLWSIFLVYSLVEATGRTFFFVQVGYMDDRLGNIHHVPVIVFVIFMSVTRSTISRICPLHDNRSQARRPLLNRVTIGMLSSLVCCIIAWRVEVYRLQEIHPITVFWLTPQFFFIAVMEGLANTGLQDFFESQVSESMIQYGPQLNELIFGIGQFLNIIFILIFRSWFKEDINTSRLDKYYAMLIVPTSLNFLCCLLVRNWYRNHEPHVTVVLEDIAQELSENIAQELPEDVAQEISEVIGQEISEDIGPEISEVIGQEISEDIGQEISENVAELASYIVDVITN